MHSELTARVGTFLWVLSELKGEREKALGDSSASLADYVLLLLGRGRSERKEKSHD